MGNIKFKGANKMNKRNEPVRLQKKEEFEILELLQTDIVFKIKFYLLFFIALAIFVGLCWLSKGQTYGYL